MDQYLNNRQNEILWNLLANPADNGHLYAYNLQRLVAEFPQSGLLQVMLSRSDTDHSMSHAAAYFNPKALYTLANSPEDLAELTDAQIIQRSNNGVAHPVHKDPHLQEEDGPGLNVFADADEETHHTEPEALVAEEHQEPVAVEAHQHDTTETIEHIHEDERATHPATYEEPHLVDEAGVQLHNHQPETVEAKVEEDIHTEAAPEEEHIAVAEPVHEDERATHPSGYEEPHVVDEAGVQLHDHQPETVGAKAGEHTETKAEHIHEDESLTEAETFKLAAPPRGIDDDVYDEIVSIDDISFVNAPKPPVAAVEPEEAIVLEEEAGETEVDGTIPVGEEKTNNERPLKVDDETEKLIINNIAATDYFVFDRAVNDRKQAETAETETADTTPKNGSLPITADKKDVSKYHDEAMPYTFLWWLNKTRIEHAGVYQPFKLDTTQAIRQQGADELQQQYYENIFHLSSVEELDRSAPKQKIEFEPKSKEDFIIRRFIAEEPHINPPDSAKLDTENKARKSSEDEDALVTETLARVYTDQMLYHKAINTYKKLMLKFPEKSRYFATQIEQIEKKTN